MFWKELLIKIIFIYSNTNVFFNIWINNCKRFSGWISYYRLLDRFTFLYLTCLIDLLYFLKLRLIELRYIETSLSYKLVHFLIVVWSHVAENDLASCIIHQNSLGCNSDIRIWGSSCNPSFLKREKGQKCCRRVLITISRWQFYFIKNFKDFFRHSCNN